MGDVQYAESTGQSDNATTTYNDKVTLTFTPPSQQDYVIIATAELKQSSASYQARCRIDIDGSSQTSIVLFRPRNSAEWYPYSAVRRVNLTSASHTIKIQWSTNNVSGTASIRNARLFVFYLGTVQYAESETRTTNATTTYTDEVTITFTPPAQKDYLIIASAVIDESSTSYACKARVWLDDTTVIGEGIRIPSNANSRFTFGVVCRVNLTNASHHFDLQHASSSASGTCGIAYSHLMAIPEDLFHEVNYAYDDSESAPAATGTWYDKVTLNYTSEAFDYLSLGSIASASKSTSYNVLTEIQNDGTAYCDTIIRNNATDYDIYFMLNKMLRVAESTTDKIRYQAGTTSARVKTARLYAIRFQTLKTTAQTETLTLSDIIGLKSVPIKQVLSEVITAVETFKKVSTLHKTWTEVITDSDSSTRSSDRHKSYSELITISDTIVKSKVKVKSLAELITLSDVIDAFKVGAGEEFFVQCSDIITLSDIYTKQLTRIKVLAETVTLSDIITRIRVKAKSLSETITLADTLARTKAYARTFTEAITLSETYTRVLSSYRVLAEVLTPHETFRPFAVLLRPLKYTSISRVRLQTGLLTEDDLSDVELKQLIAQAETEVEGWAHQAEIKLSVWYPIVPSIIIDVCTYKASEFALTRKFYDLRLELTESRAGSSYSITERGIKYYKQKADATWQTYLALAGRRTAQSEQYGSTLTITKFNEDEWRETGEKNEWNRDEDE